MNEIVERVETYVREIIVKPQILQHHLRARDFLLVLNPNASIEVQIAALTHDIERFSSEPVPYPENPEGYNDDYLLAHGKKSAEIVLDEPIDQLTNLKMNLKEVYEELAVKDFYAKIIELSGNDENRYFVRFTSVPPEVASYFLAHQKYAASP